MNSLTDKVVLVTGGVQGLGMTFCMELTQAAAVGTPLDVPCRECERGVCNKKFTLHLNQYHRINYTQR